MKAGAGQQERQPLCCDTKRLGSAHCAETTHLLVQRPCPAGGAADHASARSTAPTRTCERHVMRADARAMRGEKPRFPFDAQDLDEALKDHAVNGRSSPWPNKRGHHFFMAVLRSFLALCVLGEAFGTLLNFSEKINLSAKLTIYSRGLLFLHNAIQVTPAVIAAPAGGETSVTSVPKRQ